MWKSAVSLCLAALLAGSTLMPASAQAPAQPAASNEAAELEAAWGAARKTAVLGPGKVKLLDQGEITIPAGEVFVPAAEANRIMVALGNPATPGRFGLIVGRKDQDRWLVDLEWIKEGYVRDGDAKDWKPDTLLASLKENTERDNADRKARGLPQLDVQGWAQPPAYDATTHRLVWSLLLKDRGAPANEPQTINYNTYALGREGYFSLDLLTDSAHIAADRQVAGQLLGSLNFAPGKRYQDFNASTDKVAAYGLAALVGAVAVKKLGLLALLGAFLIKAWKLALIAIAGGTATVRKIFRRKPVGEDGAI
jgi:uncharacterized membrane-anchored protein